MTYKPPLTRMPTPLDYAVIAPIPVQVHPYPCVRAKLDDASLVEFVRPALERLLHQPHDPRRLQDAVHTELCAALDHPESVYRPIERGHIYAYPVHGEPEQYIAWQYTMWEYQDVPDGQLKCLRIDVNP